MPLSESDPSLRSLSGKTQDVQGRKIAQLGLWQWPLAASTILRVLVSVGKNAVAGFLEDCTDCNGKGLFGLD